MEQVREMIFAVCMCAILNTGVRLLSPEKMQKEIRLICTLMLILCAASKLHGGFSLDTESILYGSTARSMTFEESLIAETEKALTERLEQRLSELGISAAETRIVCTLDEYNYIKAEKIIIHIGDAARTEAAQRAAEEMFPDAETEVTADDETPKGAAFG